MGTRQNEALRLGLCRETRFRTVYNELMRCGLRKGGVMLKWGWAECGNGTEQIWYFN